jgi:hypothetical protein
MGKPEPLRLLYWTEFHWPTIGGVETYAVQFIPALRQRGYDVAVITTHTDINMWRFARVCPIVCIASNSGR